MKKNMYYQTVFSRQNNLKAKILGWFIVLSYFFRIPIELLIRKDMGERYFSLFISIVVGLAFLIFPYYMASRYGSLDTNFLFKHFGTWYIYTIIYIYFLIKRQNEVKRNPSVFDFARFSLSTGSSHSFFMNIRINGVFYPRLVETLYEPAPFFLLGLLLLFMGQPLGLVLVLCAVIYSLGYMGTYYEGDNFVMDKIDEMILNGEMERAFVNDEAPENTKGVKFYARKPDDKNLRRKVKDSFFENGDNDEGDENTQDEKQPVVVK